MSKLGTIPFSFVALFVVPVMARARLSPVLYAGSVVLLALAVTGAFLMAEGVSLLEYGPGHCRACGYNLTGLTSSR